jgi:hypothetical protein
MLTQEKSPRSSSVQNLRRIYIWWESNVLILSKRRAGLCAYTDFQRKVIETSDILPNPRKLKMFRKVSASFQLDLNYEVQGTSKGAALICIGLSTSLYF